MNASISNCRFQMNRWSDSGASSSEAKNASISRFSRDDEREYVFFERCLARGWFETIFRWWVDSELSCKTVVLDHPNGW